MTTTTVSTPAGVTEGHEVTIHTDEHGITREYREVKRKAQVGELVKVVDSARGYKTHSYNTGAITKIVEIDYESPSQTRKGADEDAPWLFDDEYVVLVATDVIHYDGKRWKTVKRKAQVGDKALITVHDYRPATNGQIVTVTWVEASGRINYVKPVIDAGAGSRPDHYLVLEPINGANFVAGDKVRVNVSTSRIGNSIDTNVPYVVEDICWEREYGDVLGVRNASDEYRSVNATDVEPWVESAVVPTVTSTGSSGPSVEDRLAALERRIDELGDTDFMRHTSAVRQIIELEARVSALEAQSASVEISVKTPVIEVKKREYTREQVIEMAKQDVEALKVGGDQYKVRVAGYNWDKFCNAEFVVNRKKRTVVCLLRGWATNTICAKGVANCAADDCFNVYIGKAIALRRALGLDVPAYYTSAPKPTKVSVGDVVTWKKQGEDSYYVTHVRSNDTYDFRNVRTGESFPGYTYKNLVDGMYAYVSDDSHDFGGGVSAGEPQ